MPSHLTLSRLRRAIALAAATATLPAQAATAAAAEWTTTLTQRHALADTQDATPLPDDLVIHVAVALRVHHRDELDAMVRPPEVQAVVRHLEQSGFTQVRVASNRLLVSADGPPPAVQRAFRAELRRFLVDQHEAFANTRAAQVPPELAEIVSAVHGLQNVNRMQTLYRRAAARPAGIAVADGSEFVAHDLFDFPKIYHADSLPPASQSTAAIIAAGDVRESVDTFEEFESQHGLVRIPVRSVAVGLPGTDTSGTIEWNLDSQAIVGAAGGALHELILYAATSLDEAPVTEAFNEAVAENRAQVINVSLGQCEDDARNSGTLATDDLIFEIARAQGQVFSVASGDSGSFTCGQKKGGQSHRASSPHVIAVGGSRVKTLDHTTWAGETVWGCRQFIECVFSGGTGGGISDSELAPPWQMQSGVLGNVPNRGIPDLSLAADPSSGALILDNHESITIGSTSLSAPLFAGFWARIQSQHRNVLEFPGPLLYKEGVDPVRAPAVYHDIVDGRNGGYSADVGWDYTSGFGSLDVARLAAEAGLPDGH